MTAPALKVSVVIATYRPGAGLDRLVASLDAQTLPTAEWEALFVDDGSGPETLARLESLAAERANWRVIPLEHSGWPSKPRNVGVEHARGEYVSFMDHDDELFPDGLRAAYSFAKRNRADILNGKESHTTAVSWAMTQYRENADNIRGQVDPFPVAPMNPHKMYRTEFLRTNGIKFHEGSRVLYEDNLFNLEALSRASVISTMADVPYYHWVRDGSTTGSSTFRRDPAEFFGSLERVLRATQEFLSEPSDAALRDAAISYQHRLRFAGHFNAAWARRSPSVRQREIELITPLIAEFIPERLDATLPRRLQAKMHLFRAGEWDALTSLAVIEDQLDPHHKLESVVPGDDGGLDITTRSVWRTPEGDPMRLEVRDGRFIRRLPDEIRSLLPAELLDITDDLRASHLAIAGRISSPLSTWAFPGSTELVSQDSEAGHEAVFLTRGRFDPATAQLGHPATPGMWDLGVDAVFLGSASQRRIAVPPDVRAAQLRLGSRDSYLVAGSDKGKLAISVDVPWHVSNAFSRGFAISPMPGGRARLTFPHVTSAADGVDGVTITLLPRRVASFAKRRRHVMRRVLERLWPAPSRPLQVSPSGAEITVPRRLFRSGRMLFVTLGGASPRQPLGIHVGTRDGEIKRLPAG
ncbi:MULTISPECIES: glycosyltransferase family 2 protein [Microbacterium]|uniref:glycosyltransferase family 2 protein n=1 Tax=Microbacterium TaxID=33882 RepID=UPI00046AA4ED|nr:MULTISPECIES: glycosyltransferase family 2 protein [Microbacterium]